MVPTTTASTVAVVTEASVRRSVGVVTVISSLILSED
jgi:hypothetical protein